MLYGARDRCSQAGCFASNPGALLRSRIRHIRRSLILRYVFALPDIHTAADRWLSSMAGTYTITRAPLGSANRHHSRNRHHGTISHHIRNVGPDLAHHMPVIFEHISLTPSVAYWHHTLASTLPLYSIRCPSQHILQSCALMPPQGPDAALQRGSTLPRGDDGRAARESVR